MNRLQDYIDLSIDELDQMLRSKNKMYGDSVSGEIKSLGLSPEDTVLVRIKDKCKRFLNILDVDSEDKTKWYESLEDCVTDLAGYCVIRRALILKKNARK